MESLRKYVTDTDLQNRGISTPELFRTITAERDIDTIIKNFYEKAHSKFILSELSFADAVFTTTQVTIPNTNYDNDYFAFTALEILSGVNKGEQIALASSVTSGNNTIVQFSETQNITAGTYDCKVWQEGKLPRLADVYLKNRRFEKSIPNWIKDCVAYQYIFREQNAGKFSAPFPLKSYKVDQDSWQEDYDTNVDYLYLAEMRISPDVLTILKDRGMLGNSV